MTFNGFFFLVQHFEIIMDLTTVIIGGFIVVIAGVCGLALMQNAKDADDAWEEAIRKKQNKHIK